MISSSHGLDIQIVQRVTALEVRLSERARSTDGSLADHETRIKFLERAVQILIWAVGALATGKSGDLADKLLGLLKP